LAATWISVASLDPEKPVLLAGLAPNHFTTELVQNSQRFAAHLLRPDQVDLAWSFAKDSGRSRDKLAGLNLTTAVTGAPILADCLAWFDCQVFNRYDTGDRTFFWADVVASEGADANAAPLREQEFFRGLTAHQKQILAAARAADTAALKPAHDQWRNQLRGL
jgi:flavin reductase (DIM6/NTAB) family NADH-FMN oxidoreductase RutF